MFEAGLSHSAKLLSDCLSTLHNECTNAEEQHELVKSAVALSIGLWTLRLAKDPDSANAEIGMRQLLDFVADCIGRDAAKIAAIRAAKVRGDHAGQ